MENLDAPLCDSINLKRKRDPSEEAPEMDRFQKLPQRPFKSENQSRKRKFNYNLDPPCPKKGRFYYINPQMTKPRRPKIIRETQKKLENDCAKKQKLHFVRSDNSGKAYLVHRGHQKSDVFLSEEMKCNFEASKKVDLSFHIVDEIALEGLDGITLEAFWKRLKNVFANHISKTVADRIWRMICGNKRINFYILKEPREKLTAVEKLELLDNYDEPAMEFKDIYPLASINGTDIRGSCSTYEDRKENNGMRKFSMDKAVKLYEQRLVFVADQSLRNKALINEEADPNLELVDVEYCMLERIGRRREHGELSHGKLPNANDKKVYHNRKVLVQHSLIFAQTLFIKSFALNINVTRTLVHLSRFYSKKKNKHILVMEQFDRMLRKAPNFQMAWKEVFQSVGKPRWIKKLVKAPEFRRLFKFSMVPYRKIYPNASRLEYLSKNQRKEKEIRIIKMIDSKVNVAAVLDEKEMKEEHVNAANTAEGHKLFNYEYLRDIFLYIMSAGRNGVILSEIHDYIKMDYYSVRMAVRTLLSRGVIISKKIDCGRQQKCRFMARSCFDPAPQTTLTEKAYKLTDKTVTRILKGYEKIANNETILYCDNEEPKDNIVLPLTIDVQSHSLICTAFCTEHLDTVSSEEITIYDIILKGLDRLLLIQSNLFDHYISEWEDFILKKESFFIGVNALNHGFGILIYEFLQTLNFAKELSEDGNIIFNVENITSETKIFKLKLERRVVEIIHSIKTSYSSYYDIDLIGKMYLFEALFNDKHTSINTIERAKLLFSYIMTEEGKRRTKLIEEIASEAINTEVELTNPVVMEKFMGANPCLLQTEEEDGVKIEIFESTKPKAYKRTNTMFESKDTDITQRYTNRANLLLSMVYKKNVIDDIVTMYKKIRTEELEMGYDTTICKKTVASLLARLVSDGYIKIYKVIISNRSITRFQIFICSTEIEHSHPSITTPIGQMKQKLYLSTRPIKPLKIKDSNRSPFGSREIQQSVQELKVMTSTKLLTDCTLDRMIGKHYGYSPKFKRMHVLHKLLFYVIRESVESRSLENFEKFELFKKCKIKVSSSEVSAMPAIYKNEISWKMFIPPLFRNSIYPPGWALLCDIILRTPLSIFVKIYNVPYDIPELDTFLNHPIKKHYLVKHLPNGITNVLWHKRKYLTYLIDSMKNLAYIGLLQFGPRNFKERDQMFLYLNSKASILDTKKSAPGYNLIEDRKYRKRTVEFRSSNDVEAFWSEMRDICLNTPLGKKKGLDGRCVTIEDPHTKPILVATLKAKEFQEALQDDTGEIPGDCQGAAGFDSSLWSFIRKNWIWSSSKKQSKKQTYKADSLNLKPIKYDSLSKDHKNMKLKTVKSVVVRRNKKKKLVVRRIVAPKNTKVREYYDAIDKAIMKKNPTLRVEWNKEEDHFLRYSRAALLFLCPYLKKQYISYSVMRDVLHSIYPKSRNKTSKAIQRRIYVLLTSDDSIKIMEGNVQNLLNSDKLRKYFEVIRNRHEYDIKISENELQVAYVYLMAYIMKHQKEIDFLLLGYVATQDFFSDSNIDVLEPLLQKEEDTIYKNPENLDEITKNTIKTVIHCSMACRKNSTNWSLQLSHIYQKFNDDIVRTAVTELKKTQSFVMNKNNDKNFANNLPFPIKFSCLYNAMKQSAYTIDMYKESYNKYSELISGNSGANTTNFITYNEVWNLWENQINISFEIPEMGIILNPEIDDHGEVIDELGKRFLFYLDKIYKKTKDDRRVSHYDKENDETDSIPKELDVEEVKRAFLKLIFRIPYLLEDNLELYYKKLMESGSHLEINNYIYLMIVELKKVVQNKNINNDGLEAFIAKTDEAKNIENQEKLLRNLAKIVFIIQTIYQEKPELSVNFEQDFSEWLDKQFKDNDNKKNESTIPHKSRYNKNYTSGMEICINRVKEGDFPTLEEIKEGMMIDGDEQRSVPHITDLIMFLNEGRYPELDTDYETIEKFNDHFIVQYPTVKEFVIDKIDEFKKERLVEDITDQSKIEKVKKLSNSSFKNPNLNEVQDIVLKLGGTQEDFKITEKLLDLIRSKKQIGVEAAEIKEKFADILSLKLASLMDCLTDLGILLRTGISSILYVYCEYQSEWMTETFASIPENEQEGSFAKDKFESIIEKGSEVIERKMQLRPWTMLDGSLNYPQFKEWLCIVLSKCVDSTNIPFRLLCEQFCHIKPVDVFYLLEVLQDIGCLSIYSFDKSENTLTSERCLIDEKEATCLDSFDDMFIKVVCTSVLSFGFFLDNVFIDC